MHLDAIYTSTDSGLNWQQQIASVPSGNVSISWHAIASSSDGNMLAAISNTTGGAVYTSEDSGATWIESPNSFFIGTFQSIASSSNGCKLAIASYDGNFIYYCCTILV